MSKPKTRFRFRFAKRWPAISWSTLFAYRYDKTVPGVPNWKNTSGNKKWRVKHYSIKYYPGRSLLLDVRRTRTSIKRRSKQNKYLDIPFKFMPVKEISFHKKLLHRPKSKPKTYVIVIQRRVLFAYIFILLGVIGSVYFGIQMNTNKAIDKPTTFSIQTPPPSKDYTKPAVLSRSSPTKINIAKISLDAPIKIVGRNTDGTMQTPSVLDYVTGWYKYSPTPGELGPSVIVGHVDSYKGVSVFWRLRELKPNDIVRISRADGTVAKFKVIAMQQFDQSNFPTKAVYGNINYAGLRLITCGGTFDHQTGHYTANTVVYASLINS